MPDLLLELFSEEIPARMQAKAAEDLRKGVTDRLVDAGLLYEGAKAFATPRRLALWVQGLPGAQPDVREEKKGPRVGAPEKAIEGFLKSAGLASHRPGEDRADRQEGRLLRRARSRSRAAPRSRSSPRSCRRSIRGVPLAEVDALGRSSAKPGALTWVRPLHSIVATFGPETEEPEVVPVHGRRHRGGRRHARPPLPRARRRSRCKRLDDYAAKLEAPKSCSTRRAAQEIILADAKNLAFAQGFELIEDEGLLEEVAGLVEWPVVLMGAFDEAFLAIPPEVIRTTIRTNQKCFVLRAPTSPCRGGSDRLANRQLHPRRQHRATDGGATIVAGNERVIRARLSDANSSTRPT